MSGLVSPSGTRMLITALFTIAPNWRWYQVLKAAPRVGSWHGELRSRENSLERCSLSRTTCARKPGMKAHTLPKFMCLEVQAAETNTSP